VWCVCVRAHVCVRARMCHTSTYIYIYIYTYINTYIHTYIHTYKYTNIHSYIHTYIQTHTHSTRAEACVLPMQLCVYMHTYIPMPVPICIALGSRVRPCSTAVCPYTLIHKLQTYTCTHMCITCKEVHVLPMRSCVHTHEYIHMHVLI